MISNFHRQDKTKYKQDQDSSSVEINTKKCCGCKKHLTFDWFFKDKSRPSGLNAYCIPCEKLKRKPRKKTINEKLILRLKFINQKIKDYKIEASKIEQHLNITKTSV
jgi:peptide methionine sulfoxide reductase MsrB